MSASNSWLKFFLLFTLPLPVICFGLSSDKDQPVHLEADSVEIDEASGVSTFQGNVIITQGSLKIWADKMWIHRRNGKTEKIITRGNPTRFKQLMDNTNEEVKGRARQAELYPDKDELHLIDEAVLVQSNDQFSSDRIIFLRSQSLLKAGASARGKQRVHVILEPEKSP